MIKDYIDKGYFLIPIKPGTKQPLVDHYFNHGSHNATNDYYILKNYTDFALVCNNITIIDVDLYKSRTNEINNLLIDLGKYQPPIQITQRGGLHIGFRHTLGLKSNLSNVDIRTTNQYVLVAPTEGYHWHKALPHVSQLPTLQFVPAGLSVAHIEPTIFQSSRGTIDTTKPDIPTTEQLEKVIDYIKEQPLAISGQGGHNITIRVVTDLRVGFNLHDELVEWLMLNVYNPLCLPPWSEQEINHKIMSLKSDSTPGYLWKRILSDEEDMSDGIRLHIAVKYCKNITNYVKCITHARIGCLLTPEQTETLLQIKFPNLIMTEQIKQAIKYPTNPRNERDGYLLLKKD